MMLRRHVIAALVATVAAACSGSKKGPTPTPAQPAATADALPIVAPAAVATSVLIGTWKTQDCQSVSGGGSAKDLLNFQDAVVIAARTFYSDDKCTAMTRTTTLQGPYKIGDSVKTATKLDLLYNQQTATYPSAAEAAKAAAGYSSGASAVCASGQAPVVSGEVVDLTACLKDPATIFVYTMFAVTGSELHLAVAGSDSVTSGKDDSSRATSLDGTVAYTKQ